MTGYKCWYEPTAIVYHKMGQSIKKVFNYDYALTIQKHILYSYFKLMPLSSIILTLPFLLLRLVALLVVSLLFMRLKYFKILLQSFKETALNDYRIIKAARNTFFQQHTIINNSAILKKQIFFLGHDLKRFYKFFLKEKPSAIDTYGKSIAEEVKDKKEKERKEVIQVVSNVESWY